VPDRVKRETAERPFAGAGISCASVVGSGGDMSPT
jgi:hypothetical protein